MKKLSTMLAMVLLTLTVLGQTTDDKAKDLEKEKFKLVQKLLSCQSMAYTVIGERDYQTRNQYVNIGNQYYNDAYQAYIKIQGLEPNMDEKLNERISTMVQMYAKAFESVDALNKPEMALALQFSKSSLKSIMIEFYCDKE